MSTMNRTAFDENATEKEKAEFEVVEQQVAAVVDAAHAIEVRNAAEQEAAVEFLAVAARERKNAEAARTKLVKPLNDHVKMINETFKPKTTALDEASQVVKQKVLVYRAEQEELRKEAQARLDAERAELARAAEEERRRREDEARIARENAARAAAAAEAEAQRAAARRREEMQRQASEMDVRCSRMTQQSLEQAVAVARAGGDEVAAEVDALGEAAARELERRRAARRAQEAVAAARQAEEDARAAEEAARAAPVLDVPVAVVAPQEQMRSSSGSASSRRPWVGTVEDESKVPREFLVVDQRAINAAVRAGKRWIPGVRIEQVDQLAVRAKT